MKRTIWLIVSILALVAGGCGGGGQGHASPTTVLVPIQGSTTTVPAGQPDTSVIPPVITVPYVNAVLVKLNAIYSDGLRTALTAKSITPAVTTDFRAIYSPALFAQEINGLKLQLDNFPGHLLPSGARIITALKLYTTSPSCVFMSVVTNLDQIVAPPPTPLASEYYALVLKVPGQDPKGINNTPGLWQQFRFLHHIGRRKFMYERAARLSIMGTLGRAVMRVSLVAIIPMILFARIPNVKALPSGAGCINLVYAIACGGSSVSLVSPSLPPSPAPASQPGGPATGQGATATAPASAAPMANPLTVASLASKPGGGSCAAFSTASLAAPPSPAVVAAEQGAGNVFTIQYGLCPAAPPAAAATPVAQGAPAAPPTPTPAQFAEQFWRTVPLPSPHPTIPPGYAITGKPAFLVTGGTTAPPAYTFPTPFGVLQIVAHGSYQINWGDGATSGPYTSEGLPYPNGNIQHTYDNVGTYTVTVTEAWTATWSLGPLNGTLSQLQTGGTIPNFVVRQVQAVIGG